MEENSNKPVEGIEKVVVIIHDDEKKVEQEEEQNHSEIPLIAMEVASEAMWASSVSGFFEAVVSIIGD